MDRQYLLIPKWDKGTSTYVNERATCTVGKNMVRIQQRIPSNGSMLKSDDSMLRSEDSLLANEDTMLRCKYNK